MTIQVACIVDFINSYSSGYLSQLCCVCRQDNKL